MKKLGLAALKELLEQPQKIVVTTHNKPDGDAIGSSLAIYHFLKRKGHQIHVVSPTIYSEGLHFLPGDDTVVVAEENIDLAKKLYDEADIVFTLDFNALHRVKYLGDWMRQKKNDKLFIMIDHHIFPQDYDHFRKWDEKASSTCELIYEWMRDLDELEAIDKTIATCLYLGIVTDTGRFKYGVRNPKLYGIVADLVSKGIEVVKLNQLIYDCATETEIRYLGFALSERLEVLPEYNAAIMPLNVADLEKFGLHESTYETDALIGEIMSMSNVKYLAVLVDKGDSVKLSLRSKGDFDVQKIAKEHFEGGGHKNAAGGRALLSVAETSQKIKDLLPLYVEKLTEV